LPRTKPRNVDGIRLDLGTKERMILEDLAFSYRLQATLPSLAAVLKDASALYAIAIMIEWVTGKDIPGVISPDDSAGEILAGIRDWVKSQDVPGTEGEGTFGMFFNAGLGPGSPLGSLFGALGIDPLDLGVTE
jgi:hypothetical protein